jgi:hypothetical protein
MEKNQSQSKPKSPEEQAREGLAAVAGSADNEPLRLLRLVVQAKDTPENRKALLAIRETAMTRSFSSGHAVVKLEHVIVASMDLPNAKLTDEATSSV